MGGLKGKGRVFSDLSSGSMGDAGVQKGDDLTLFKSIKDCFL